MAIPRNPAILTAAKSATAEDSLKQFGIVLLESLGAGAVAVVLVLAAVLVIVGIYVQVIWPLTDWDLVNVSLEEYRSLATAVLTLVFIAGFAAGYWCISGAAWKPVRPRAIPSQKAVARPRR